MIRVVTLSPFEDGDIVALCRTLYQAFGLGTEFAGEKPIPASARQEDGRYDAEKVAAEASSPRLIADDKVLFLTAEALALPPGPLGEPQCWGFAQQGGARAVVSVKRIPARGVSEASIEAWRRRVAREAIHFVGHLWELHHCYDGRCAMHPSWSPNLAATPDADLCNFCREKSERKVRLAKT